MAPELLIGDPPTTKSDMYAFGVLLYEIFARREPYEGEKVADVLLAVADRKRAELKRPETSALDMPPLFAEIMGACWALDPADRPSFEHIAAQIWSRSASLDGPGSAAPSVRGTSQERLRARFPAHVAEALEEGLPVEPEEFECVSILCAQVAGLAELAQRREARAVTGALDRLYEKLDALAARYELFPVETVGDAYMVVGNLPDPQPDHAARVAHFALHAVAAAESILIEPEDPASGSLGLRVGFHAGPCVASVMGRASPRYSLLG